MQFLDLPRDMHQEILLIYPSSFFLLSQTCHYFADLCRGFVPIAQKLFLRTIEKTINNRIQLLLELNDHPAFLTAISASLPIYLTLQYTILPNDQKHGSMKVFHGNILISQVNYRYGQLHGSYQWWYVNSQIAIDGIFHNGQRHANWTVYSSDGNMQTQVAYNHGMMVIESLNMPV